MTGRQVAVGVVIVMLLAASQIRADVCRIVNGSFEDDGWITDITAKEPNGWDVNVPVGKFFGYVKQDWPTDGTFNLTLDSLRYKTFTVNDMATVSQQVDLTGIDEVIFDLKLATYPNNYLYPWDPAKCTAVVLIDGDAVWESNSVGTDVRGEYFDQTYAVESKYKDGQPHLLSFGIRVNVAEKLSTSYITHWDYIECAIYCGGGGLLAGDFNHDCFVDANDLKLLTEVWLDEVEPNDKYNLFHGDDLPDYGTINFFDFALFADTWLGSSYVENP